MNSQRMRCTKLLQRRICASKACVYRATRASLIRLCKSVHSHRNSTVWRMPSRVSCVCVATAMHEYSSIGPRTHPRKFAQSPSQRKGRAYADRIAWLCTVLVDCADDNVDRVSKILYTNSSAAQCSHASNVLLLLLSQLCAMVCACSIIAAMR